MAEVRINGKRFPTLQTVDTLGALVNKLDQLGAKEGNSLTMVKVNGIETDIDSAEMFKLRLDSSDIVEALMESAEQLSLQSLQVAQEMAELLVFDIKVATLNLWDNTRTQAKNLDTLLKDCSMFLKLAARPVELLGRDPRNAEKSVEDCLRFLDRIADGIEGSILLAANEQQRDACRVLVGKVMPNIENWLLATEAFSDKLNLTRFEYNVAGAQNSATSARLSAQ